MLVLSSPSGAGKSSLARALIKSDQNTKLSVSVTTRAPRAAEVDGVDYHFIDNDKFENLRLAGSFLESADVFGRCYGTLKSEVEPYIKKAIDVVFDVDWQGARALRKNSIADVISIYILPPSLSELKDRLVKRMQDENEVIERRMDNAINEISHYDEYDYVVINDQFEDALHSIKSILEAERLRLCRLDLPKGLFPG
jgi:guanylate kinase